MGTLVGTFYSVMGTPITEDGWTQSHFNWRIFACTGRFCWHGWLPGLFVYIAPQYWINRQLWLGLGECLIETLECYHGGRCAFFTFPHHRRAGGSFTRWFGLWTTGRPPYGLSRQTSTLQSSAGSKHCCSMVVAFLEDDLDETSLADVALRHWGERGMKHQDFSIVDHFCTSLSEELATLVISSKD